MLLLENKIPGVVWDGLELATDGMVPHLPMRTGEYGVRAGNRTQLVLWVGRECL